MTKRKKAKAARSVREPHGGGIRTTYPAEDRKREQEIRERAEKATAPNGCTIIRSTDDVALEFAIAHEDRVWLLAELAKVRSETIGEAATRLELLKCESADPSWNGAIDVAIDALKTEEG